MYAMRYIYICYYCVIGSLCVYSDEIPNLFNVILFEYELRLLHGNEFIFIVSFSVVIIYIYIYIYIYHIEILNSMGYHYTDWNVPNAYGVVILIIL